MNIFEGNGDASKEYHDYVNNIILQGYAAAILQLVARGVKAWKAAALNGAAACVLYGTL